METIKLYRCTCGEDVYESDTNCVACNAPVDPTLFKEVPTNEIKQTPRHDRRVRKVIISPQSMIQFLREGVNHVTENALPLDARLAGAGYDYYQNGFVLFVASKEFAFVPEGTTAPDHPPIAVRTDITQ